MSGVASLAGGGAPMAAAPIGVIAVVVAVVTTEDDGDPAASTGDSGMLAAPSYKHARPFVDSFAYPMSAAVGRGATPEIPKGNLTGREYHM